MAACRTCRNLCVEPDGDDARDQNVLQTEASINFEVDVPVGQWIESKDAGCETCRLVWDVIVRFDEELALLLGRGGCDDVSATSVGLEGWVGLPLLLVLDDLPRGRYFQAIELYRTESRGSLMTAVGRGEHVKEELDLVSSVALIDGWTHGCLKDHGDCSDQDARTLPTRVLRLSPGREQICINLHVAETGQTARYIALSYC